MLFLSKSNAKRRVTSQFTKFSKASHFLECTTPHVDFELLKLDMIMLFLHHPVPCPHSLDINPSLIKSFSIKDKS